MFGFEVRIRREPGIPLALGVALLFGAKVALSSADPLLVAGCFNLAQASAFSCTIITQPRTWGSCCGELREQGLPPNEMRKTESNDAAFHRTRYSASASSAATAATLKLRGRGGAQPNCQPINAILTLQGRAEAERLRSTRFVPKQ
jgi:hypothetical protein